MDGQTDRQIGSYVASDYCSEKVKAKKTTVRETMCLIGEEYKLQVILPLGPIGFQDPSDMQRSPNRIVLMWNLYLLSPYNVPSPMESIKWL